MKTYYDVLSVGRVRQSIKRELKQMDRGFYGVGFSHPGIECFIAQIGKLLTHYGCKSGIGIHMQASMELLIMEAGISTQPLAEKYNAYSICVTHCWLTSVWEKLDIFGMQIKICKLTEGFPQEQDSWLMLEFKNENYSKEELMRLNRVRCYQQVLYLSDILDASSNTIDSKYIKHCQQGDA
jgi:hypothetical protein